jgi:hypothetical protein
MFIRMDAWDKDQVKISDGWCVWCVMGDGG